MFLSPLQGEFFHILAVQPTECLEDESVPKLGTPQDISLGPKLKHIYIADSIKVAIGIGNRALGNGKLLFGGHSCKSLYCSICSNAQCLITKATFFDFKIAVYLVYTTIVDTVFRAL